MAIVTHGRVVLTLALTLSAAGALAEPSSRGSVDATGSVAGVPMRLGAPLLETTDLDRTVAWYRDRLGFRAIKTASGPHGRGALLSRAGTMIAIRERAAHPQLENLNKVAFALLVEDVDAETNRLTMAGAELVAPPHDRLDHEYRIARIRDQDRRIIELREPLEP